MFIGDKEKNLISKEFMPEISKDFKNFTITIKGRPLLIMAGL